MSQLNSTLREAADQNKELLGVLAATDYAPASLKQNTSYISDLKAQIANTDEELKRLHTITEDERKDHVKYRDSTFKRWTYKLGGSKGQDKFTSRQEKEEKEFLQAWQSERSAKESRDELASALQTAELHQSQLQTDAERHERAQRELDTLYNSIFSGPTPDVPGEDGLEEALVRCREHFEVSQSRLTSDNQALSALAKAGQSLDMANKGIQEALQMSTGDMFGGGTFIDMMERDALAGAQNNVHAVIRHMSAAQHRQSEIRPLTEISIDQGHLFSDVLFDNVFSDMAQHERIQTSAAQLQQAMKDLHGQIIGQSERVTRGEATLRQAGEDLEASRLELQKIRAEAFEKVVGSGSGDDVAPPAYTSAT